MCNLQVSLHKIRQFIGRLLRKLEEPVSVASGRVRRTWNLFENVVDISQFVKNSFGVARFLEALHKILHIGASYLAVLLTA